jgi:hypothetical protein
MNVYYHFSPFRHPIGSYLRPGNFGRLIRCFGAISQCHRRETAYENHRIERHPHAPSRLDALFCLPTLRECAIYRKSIATAKNRFLFEIRADEPGFFANIQDVEPSSKAQFDAASMDAYWRGWTPSAKDDDLLFREILLTRGAYVGREIPIDPAL